MIVTETNRLVTAQGKNKLGLLDYQKLLVASLCNQIDQNVNIVVDEVAAQMEVDNEEDGKGEEREEGQAGANHGVLEAAPAMGAPRGPRKDPTSRLVGGSELTPGPHFLLLQGKPALRGSAESAGIGEKIRKDTRYTVTTKTTVRSNSLDCQFLVVPPLPTFENVCQIKNK